MSGNRAALVCGGNTGCSQMATACAGRDRTDRGFDIDNVTGGTYPTEHVHQAVIDAMQERDIDISDWTPRPITPDEIEVANYVITMGCSGSEFRPPPGTVRTSSGTWSLPVVPRSVLSVS